MKKRIIHFAAVICTSAHLLICTSAVAQSSMTIDASQVISNFKFIDSGGNQDKNYHSIFSGAYSLGYRYSTDGGFLLHARFGMRNAGATMVYDAMNYSWNLKYADVKLGLGYMYKMNRFSPYLLVSGYYASLLTATQTLNNQNYDIKNSKSIQKMDYGVFITPGIQFKASDNISAYAEFNYMMGLANLETGGNGEKSYNKAYSLTLGVAFTMGSKTSPKLKSK